MRFDARSSMSMVLATHLVCKDSRRGDLSGIRQPKFEVERLHCSDCKRNRPRHEGGFNRDNCLFFGITIISFFFVIGQYVGKRQKLASRRISSKLPSVLIFFNFLQDKLLLRTSCFLLIVLVFLSIPSVSTLNFTCLCFFVMSRTSFLVSVVSSLLFGALTAQNLFLVLFQNSVSLLI